MSFIDYTDDTNLGKEPCPNDWRIWTASDNFQLMQGDTDMSGDWYKYTKCGPMEFADYDDMR